MPRGRPPKVNTQAETLMKALEFVSMASMADDDQPHRAHVMLAGNMAIASTGQISAGHPIAEDLSLAPHLEKFMIALNKCGKTLQIAQTPGGQLSVKGDKIRVIVPSLANADMVTIQPEPSVAIIDNRLKDAFKPCNALATEAGKTVMFSSVLLKANSCMAVLGFDRSAVGMLESWHGIDLPPNMVLPKLFTAAVCKAEYDLSGFGFTWSQELGRPSSVTFWFDNGAWIKSSCYSDPWTDVSGVIGANMFPKDVPAGLFDGVEACANFSDDDEPNVYFIDGKVMSHPTPDKGAVYEVRGLEGGKRFNAKVITKMAPFITQIDLTTYADKAYFVGGKPDMPLRGVFMGMTGGVNPVDESAKQPEDATHWTPREGEPIAEPEPLHTIEDAGEYETARDVAGANDYIPGNYEIETDVNPNVGWGN